MTVFKCKMCGGTLEFNPGDTVAVCDSCGTKQTLPKLDDDRRANLYDRANHFRRSNEYDKAMGIYEQILAEDNTDAEAYWSLVLCRYGIEYVEDPATHKRVPTVNRAQFTSIFDDDNYKSALHYADAAQREVYEAEARAINEIQKGILAISQKEQPFDVFICYKETDASGRRTPDSVLANDLYHQLTQEGFTVFFARITLEDKLGTAYEPYIFAALNSAKVMVVLGTKPEYFNAVWVKNEWSRYLALVKQSGGKKLLIPAYKDMDPYDLPEEFSHLQAQDMGKLGFMQDLIRGIKKIISADEPKATVKETVVVGGGSAGVAPLLKRAFMFLEDGNWQEADAYCEKVLDIEPENARAYLGKLMAELQVHTQESLIDCKAPFDGSDNYRKAIRFGDESLQQMLTSTVDGINARNEENRLSGIYQNAQSKMAIAGAEDDYTAAALLFESISEYRDAAALGEECREKAETARKDAILAAGNAALEKAKSISDYESALEQFASIPGWKNADENAALCQRRMEEIRLETERKKEQHRVAAEAVKKKAKKIVVIVAPIACAMALLIVLLVNVIIPYKKYNAAYNAAVALMDSEQWNEAIAQFQSLDGYKDSDEQIIACKDGLYSKAISLMEAGSLDEASAIFHELNHFKESVQNLNKISFLNLKKSLGDIKVGDYIIIGQYDSKDIEWLALEKTDERVLLISKDSIYQDRFGFSDSNSWENCPLRQWLDVNFRSTAFSENEKRLILKTAIDIEDETQNTEENHRTISDRIFLLSVAEVEKYFSSVESRQCGYSWWLRSPNRKSGWHTTAPAVDSGGQINFYKFDEQFGVRPAMWISLE